MSFTGDNPFIDIPDWGDRYAAYGYYSGITVGINNEHTLFAPDRDITFQEFTAFLLRVLGYNEATGDFLYEQAIAKASAVDLFSPYDISKIAADNYVRGNAVLEMANALLTKAKGSNELLLYQLADKGVFTQADADWLFENIR